jgi:hypothetical protein
MLSKTIVALAATAVCGLAACSSAGTTGQRNQADISKIPTGLGHTSTVESPGGQRAASVPATAGGASSFCAEMASVGQTVVALGGGDPTKADPAVYEREMNQLVATAPGAVKSDIEAIGGVELEVVKGNLGAEAKMHQPAMLQHVGHFVTWMQANCPGVLDVPSDLPSE